MILVALVLGLGVGAAWPSRPRRIRLAAVRAPARSPRRPLDRRLLAGVAALVAALLVSPVLGLLVAVLAWAHPRWAAHRAVLRRRSAVADAVPEAADLLALAVAGGCSVPSAVQTAGRWSPSPLGPALAATDQQVAAGRPLGEALERLADQLGDPVRPLVDVLLMSERYGVPVAEGLDRVAREARLDQRRRGEERARRVPVLLLFPLVVCILPAFGLLTVVPLLVGSLPDLPPPTP